MISYNEPDMPSYEFEDEDGYKVTMGVVSAGPSELSVSIRSTGPYVTIPADQLDHVRGFFFDVIDINDVRQEIEGTQ